MKLTEFHMDEIRQALNDHSITTIEQVPTGIRDLRAQLMEAVQLLRDIKPEIPSWDRWDQIDDFLMSVDIE